MCKLIGDDYVEDCNCECKGDIVVVMEWVFVEMVGEMEGFNVVMVVKMMCWLFDGMVFVGVMEVDVKMIGDVFEVEEGDVFVVDFLVEVESDELLFLFVFFSGDVV